MKFMKVNKSFVCHWITNHVHVEHDSYLGFIIGMLLELCFMSIETHARLSALGTQLKPTSRPTTLTSIMSLIRIIGQYMTVFLLTCPHGWKEEGVGQVEIGVEGMMKKKKTKEAKRLSAIIVIIWWQCKFM